jgi:hypothetical protein
MNNSNDKQNRANNSRGQNDQMGAQDNLDTNTQASSSTNARDTEEDTGTMGRDDS